MTSLCTAAVFVNQGRSGMFVGRFLGAGKRGARKEEKQEIEKEGAETPRSNSRKWADGGGLCSLCGFNESTVFRTRRGTRELA